MSSDLTPAAAEGFAAGLVGAEAVKACPHYSSSPSGMAWLVGGWLKATGRSAPRAVRMSRGYRLHANDMLVDANDPAALVRLK